MSECTHDCSSCGENCSSRQIQKEKQNDQSNIKKVIGVVSGKGGVGKSLITSLLAANAQKAGYNAAILDADITGPSIPKLFGIKEKAFSPDGKRIAFSANINAPQSRYDFDIWIMDADGSNLTQVTSSQAMDDLPAWTPDGNAIYFRSNRNLHWGIWKIQVPTAQHPKP